VQLNDGTQVEAELVIVATGVRPDLELVASTTIQTDHGILVDDRMRSNVPGIYAAGDVAQGPVRHSDQREVHAIQPTAVDHGRIAGANMAGHSVQYPGSLSMNVLDVCGLQCCSFGRWNDDASERATTICHPGSSIYRRLCWTNDQITGAIFVGRARDAGMLTDIGMVKGLIQTGVRLGPWKDFLQQHPFDIRRAYIASRVPEQLARETLLGQPSTDRHYRSGGELLRHIPGQSHSLYLDRPSAS
jgi:NAD(P)H-nitrite reductase large subunit